MESNLVAAHLLRVEDPLALEHTDHRPPDEEQLPAVLVIPYGPGLTEPHLVVLTDPDRHRLPLPAGWITTDVHRVVAVQARRPRVLIRRDHAACGAIARLFGRRPGCDVVVRHRRGGCVLRLRDGRLVAVEGPRIGGDRAVSAYAMYGSAVHCWQSAGISVSALEEAVVAVGRYATSTTERSARFLVTGRAELKIRRPRPMTAVRRAA